MRVRLNCWGVLGLAADACGVDALFLEYQGVRREGRKGVGFVWGVEGHAARVRVMSGDESGRHVARCCVM